MKNLTQITAFAAILIGSIGFIGSANAAKGGIPGPPDGGGGGEPPQDFGDLIILLRDANGVPILDANLCQQPIAFPSDTCTLTDATVPVDPDTCAVEAEFAGCTQEVDFGRVNVSRAPASVFEQQLADVVVNLATSDCVVSLDPAGRMVTSAGTIDSPLQNLAIYRQLMLTGSIGVSLPQDATVLDTAARGLGVSSDKTGEVNVDLVAYLNQIMGLSDPATTTILDKICIDVREEVQGTVQLVQKCYLDYGAYGYIRDANFVALPAPPYIPDTGPVAGWFEYLAFVPGTELDPRFQILEGPITTAVFADEPFSDVNIGGFAQASDDTRAVINFMHDWAIPDADVFATAVPCEALDEILYDLAISEESGLQVPKNYVDGGEREFFVNVANNGPDTANGTVTVVATANGESIDCGVADCTWTLPPIVGLLEGQTASFTQLFTITTTSDTINWTATVVADPPGTDPVLGNNVQTATSSVRASGGGGGGNGGGNPN